MNRKTTIAVYVWPIVLILLVLKLAKILLVSWFWVFFPIIVPIAILLAISGVVLLAIVISIVRNQVRIKK